MTVELLFLACRGDDNHWRLPAARVSQTPIISNLTMQFVAKTWLAVSGVPKNHCYIGGVYRWLLGSIIPNYSLHIDLDFRSMYGVCHDKVANVCLFVTFDLDMNVCNLYHLVPQQCQVMSSECSLVHL